jgi:hypothetical protein
MRHSTRLLAAAAALSLLTSQAHAQSITDRFKSLFGGSSEPAQPAPGQATTENELTCPSVSIRSGASTFGVGLPGKAAAGADLRYQATITRTARECNLSGGQILARIGIQGRVIAGPAGAPTSVDIPMRVAVVSEGISPKTIATKAFRTTVAMQPDGTVPFTLVAEDVVYPVPPAAESDNYVFYVGFDPQALGPEPKAKAKKKK